MNIDTCKINLAEANNHPWPPIPPTSFKRYNLLQLFFIIFTYVAGWRPRRSIKMCGWNGEEFNLIGSVEFVEEFYNQLRDQAVAYINIDSAVAGSTVNSFSL